MQPNLETVFEHAPDGTLPLTEGFLQLHPGYWAAIVLVVLAAVFAAKIQAIDRRLPAILAPAILLVVTCIGAFQLHHERYDNWMDQQVKPYIDSLPPQELEIVAVKRDGDRYTVEFSDAGGERESLTGRYTVHYSLPDNEVPYVSVRHLMDPLPHGVNPGYYNPVLYLPQQLAPEPEAIR